MHTDHGLLGENTAWLNDGVEDEIVLLFEPEEKESLITSRSSSSPFPPSAAHLL